jgi:putative oxidoreductase
MAWESLVYGVYLGEIVAPVLVIIGLFTRLGGWIMVVNMLFAIGLVHMSDIFALTERGAWAIETQALFLVLALAVAVFGSGKYAVKPNGLSKTAKTEES